jgi:hypothetical protein
MPVSDRQHDAFDNPAKAACRVGNLRVLRESVYRSNSRQSKINTSIEEASLMQTTLRMETTVLPGHRLEISNPELPDGATVEVIVVVPEQLKPGRMSMLEFLETLPPGPSPRCYPTWEEYERHLQEEKNSWER